MNETMPGFDDLALFLLVVEGGSLAEAARVSGVPLPTLSRRMTRLERDTGRALFVRGKAGYAPTGDGRALAAEVAELAALRRRLRRWKEADPGPRRVRITAGFWTSRFLARHLPAASDWVPEFLPSNAPLDLARREADIGIRNRAPDHPWLARQRARRIDYAVYGLPDAPEGFVTLPRDAGLTPSQRWVHDHHADRIVTTATDTRLCLDLALRGLGRVVLPCFVGDGEYLHRFDHRLAELGHDEWIVSHHEARHDPPIRAALDAVAALLT